MASVLRELAASPLAARHRMIFITTWRRDEPPARRLRTSAAGLLRLTAWSVRPGPRVVHVHTAVRGSWYRKAAYVRLARALGRPVILQVHSGAVDIAAFWERLGPRRRSFVRRSSPRRIAC
jgi:hypothetical protein